jgi:quercetin dioxygenase-like cupin family protein/DNA-binding Xre family transcriptional regulator
MPQAIPLPVRAHAPIGPRLRAARKARRMTIEALADATGLTKSFLSKLERDATSASVASLLRVCDALGLRPGTLFDPPATWLVRGGEAPAVNYGGAGVHDALLTPGSEGKVMVVRSDIVPGGSSGTKPYAMDSDIEVAHVLDGELELTLGGETHMLCAGDTITYAPREPHSWRNPSPTAPARVIWLLTPAP